jgi:hypothetical protein
MKELKRGKKGALVTYTIIGAILVIIAAAILFMIYNKVPKNYDKDACHNSVLLRNNAFLRGDIIPGVNTEIIPLQCKTEEVKINDADQETIKRTIADSMYDCWWMLGEGKINFFARKLTRSSYCVICSTIDFSDNVKERYPKIENFDSYLINNKIPLHNETYMQYFTGKEIHAGDQNLAQQGSVNIDTSKSYAVIYSLVKRDKLLEVVGGIAGELGVGLGVSAAAGAIGITIGTGGIVLVAAIGLVAGAVVVDKLRDLITNNPDEYWVQFNLLPFDAKYINDFGCDDMESIP